MIPKTAYRTVQMFGNLRLGGMAPFFAILLVGAVVLWFINAIAPLAPFVYSLF